MAGIGSFLGGVASGVDTARKQNLAEKTQADNNAIQQEQLSLARAASGRANASAQREADNQMRQRVDGAVNDLWATMEKMSVSYQQAGHHPEEAAPVLQPLAQQAMDLLKTSGRDKDAEAFAAKYKALTTLPVANTTPKFEVAGSNGPGQNVYWQVNPAADGGAGPVKSGSSGQTVGIDPSILKDLPTNDDGTPLTGSALLAYLHKQDPNTATIVQSMVEGKMAPPSAYALTKDPNRWSTALTLANAVDPNFDQTTWPGRVKASNEFKSGGQQSPAGIISAGQGALLHLGELSDAAVKLGNYGTGLPFNRTLNTVTNAAARESGKGAKQISFNAAVGKFAPEATRLYRGAGGAEADIKREIEEFDVNGSPEELAAALEKNKQLMLDKLNVMQDRYHTNVSGGVTDFPIYTKQVQEAIDRIDANIAKLRGTAAPSASGATSGAQAGVQAAAAPTSAPAGKNMGSSLSSQQLQQDIATAKAQLATVPPQNQAAARAAIIQKLQTVYGNADFSGL